MRQYQLLDSSGCFSLLFFPFVVFFVSMAGAVWTLIVETMIDSKRQQCGVSAIVDIHMKMPDRQRTKTYERAKWIHFPSVFPIFLP